MLVFFRIQFKTSGRCTAHKNGRRKVWLNIGVATQIRSVTIVYDGNIYSSSSLTTKFTRGYFDLTKNNTTAGQQFTSSKSAVSGSQLSPTISGKTVKYQFTEETKALLIADTSLDFVSISVSFTDYEPETTVRPKMSQPGKSPCKNK